MKTLKIGTGALTGSEISLGCMRLTKSYLLPKFTFYIMKVSYI